MPPEVEKKAAPAAGVSANDILAAIARMSQTERETLGAILGGKREREGGKTPKFSDTLKAVGTERAAICKHIAAMQKATGADDGGVAYAGAVADFRAAFPAFVNGAETNSSYRQKPLMHSMNVALQWFNANPVA